MPLVLNDKTKLKFKYLSNHIRNANVHSEKEDIPNCTVTHTHL